MILENKTAGFCSSMNIENLCVCGILPVFWHNCVAAINERITIHCLKGAQKQVCKQ